jgi:hypothetical protein
MENKRKVVWIVKGVMIVSVGKRIFETKYFPFFRQGQHEDYAVFGMRFPSGHIEEIVIFDEADYMEELKMHMEFLIQEYALEEDDMLTPRAMKMKLDILDMIDEKG